MHMPRNAYSLLVCWIDRSIISYRSSSTLYRRRHPPTRAMTTRLGSSLTAAPLYACVIAIAPILVHVTSGTATTAERPTSSSWPALSRRSPTPFTAAVAAAAVMTAADRGPSATVCRRRRRCCVAEASARWLIAPTRWHGRTPGDRCQQAATPPWHWDTRLHCRCLPTSSHDTRWVKSTCTYVS